jgi:peptidoglycan hydrolase-like protein with peptidoglycan-binding domain
MTLAQRSWLAACGVALAVGLAVGPAVLASGGAAASHLGHTLPALGPALGPVLEPAGLAFAATSVDDMPAAMRTAYIRGIQDELAAHGYRPGPADGIVGLRTRQAIRQYQRDAGLTVDGVASKELLEHLKFAQPRVVAGPPPAPDPLVLEVQTQLRDLGYHRGALDGLMGGATREAIRAYRYDVGLPISGAVDGPLLESLRLQHQGAGAGRATEEEPDRELAQEPAQEPAQESAQEPARELDQEPILATPPAPAE